VVSWDVCVCDFSGRYVDPCTFGVSALASFREVSVTTLETFDTGLATDHGKRGAALWQAFAQHGSVSAAATAGTSSAAAALAAAGTAATRSGLKDGEERGSVRGCTLGAAVCQQLTSPLAPGEARQFTFALTWDAPTVHTALDS